MRPTFWDREIVAATPTTKKTASASIIGSQQITRPNENKISHRWRKRAHQNETCFTKSNVDFAMASLWLERR
jgi:hypothetical protein